MDGGDSFPDIPGTGTKDRDSLPRSLDAQFLHSRLERRGFETEKLSGAPFTADLSSGQTQNPDNVVLLDVIEVEVLAGVRTGE